MKKVLYFILFNFVVLTLNAQPTITETLISSAYSHAFSGLISKSGLETKLKGDGPYTIFAPNDDAFLKLPKGTIYSMSNPKTEADKIKLRKFVENYIVKGSYDVAKLKTVTQITTLSNKVLKVESNFKEVKINGILLEKKDVKAKNGMIHTLGTTFTE